MTMNELWNFVRARQLAVRRRWAILTRGQFTPYPAIPDGLAFNPTDYTKAVAECLTGELDWACVSKDDAPDWQHEARTKLRGLLRLPKTVPQASVQSETTMPIASGYRRRRVYVRFGDGWDAPVDLVSSKVGEPAERPVVICMQGTNSGAHLSLGEVRMPADVYKVASGSALALQAADHGFLAVSFERSAYGERQERSLAKQSSNPSVDPAFHLLSLGQTVLGQTVSELEALKDWIVRDIAPGKPVYLAGYSSAGTAAVAAAAANDGFAGIAVGGCVGFIRDTLLKRAGGGYNDIPDMLKWFEFDAQLALVAPRPCLVIAGARDHIWPLSGAEPVISSARRAWEMLGCADDLELIGPPGAHTYYPDLMWPAFERMVAGEA